MPKSSSARQRGGFVLGLIVGLLLGLALALGVALYVTKVPIPFVDKLPQRSAEQDAAEIERNKNWDPNAGLNGNRTAKPASAAAGPVTATPALPKPADKAMVVTPAERAMPAASAGRDPAAILAGQRPAASSPSAPEAFVYFVQAGAYGRSDDAEQQRAKLALAGFESKVSERDQGGRQVYRVRLGPFDKRSEAESTQDRLGSNGVEAALVRVQK